MKRIILAIFCLLGTPMLVFAATGTSVSGTSLYQQCTAAPETEANHLCEVWVIGFTTGLTDTQAMIAAKHGAPVTCIPLGEGGASPDQVRLIIEKFMRNYPQLLNYPADIVALKAINLAFPCSKSN